MLEFILLWNFNLATTFELLFLFFILYLTENFYGISAFAIEKTVIITN